MDNKDQIKDLFADKLGQIEVPVRPELWSSISSQIGTSAVAGSSAAGLSFVSKIIIGVSVVAASTVAGVYLLNSKDQKQAVETKKDETVHSAANIEANSSEQSKSESSNKDKLPELERLMIYSPPNVIDVDGESITTYSHEVSNTSSSIVDENSKPISPLIGGLKSPSVTELADIKAPTQIAVLPPERIIQDDPHVDEEAISNAVSSVEIKTNTFTPNGDGINDELFIESSGELFDFNLVILDRMNKVVFQSSDPNFKWDGRNQGGDFVDEGTYLYYLTAVDASGKKVAKANSLTINR